MLHTLCFRRKREDLGLSPTKHEWSEHCPGTRDSLLRQQIGVAFPVEDCAKIRLGVGECLFVDEHEERHKFLKIVLQGCPGQKQSPSRSNRHEVAVCFGRTGFELMTLVVDAGLSSALCRLRNETHLEIDFLAEEAEIIVRCDLSI